MKYCLILLLILSLTLALIFFASYDRPVVKTEGDIWVSGFVAILCSIALTQLGSALILLL